MPSVKTDPSDWTWGAEHELGDWDTSIPLPKGYTRSPDHTVVNTNGVAAQPKTAVYRYGGEINTPPTTTITKQVECLEEVVATYPNAVVNHRSNLHLHVRIPGLKASLALMKRIQKYIHDQLPAVLPSLEEIPKGVTPAERKRARRRKVSHQTFLTNTRLQHQLAAKSMTEFFEREVPVSKAGVVMWHAQPRCCVNLRQLLQTDTIEFRHFPGTLDPGELTTCLEWCQTFLVAALTEQPLSKVWEEFYVDIDRHNIPPFPEFPAFDEEREVMYQATAAKNGLKPVEIKANIQLILAGKFNAKDSPTVYAQARERAGCVPR